MRGYLGLGLLAAVAAVFGACRGADTTGGAVQGGGSMAEGWVGPDRFRVTATGVPKQGLQDRTQRRESAKEAARIMAQARIMEKFTAARRESGAGAAEQASPAVAVSREFGALVKAGTIVNATYDEDDNCEIVYQVEKNNLKNEVAGGAPAAKK
jgi:hypothetical protein